MGVPVVTLTGDSHAHNVGATILRQVGHEELVAHTKEAYVEAALRLATDPQRLLSIRSSLRDKMQRSYLCNPSGFTRNLEETYLRLWRKHPPLQRSRTSCVVTNPPTVHAATSDPRLFVGTARPEAAAGNNPTTPNTTLRDGTTAVKKVKIAKGELSFLHDAYRDDAD